MSISVPVALQDEALLALKRKGNPFRQQFARNSDDPVCSLYHVQDLFAPERVLLQSLVEGYRTQPERPTCVLPLLGARGAGKTHLLHCLKHGPAMAAQLFVTPGTFRVDNAGADSSFLEYVLYQFINVLLAGAEQRGARPLVYVGEQLTRRVLREVIGSMDEASRLHLLPTSGLRKWGQRLGMGRRGTLTAIEELLERLKSSPQPCQVIARQADLDPEKLTGLVLNYLGQHGPRDLKGEFRRRLMEGFLRAALLGEEGHLGDYLTDGFADVPFLVRPTRAQLTLSLLQAMTELIVGSGIPVAVAFDQLEELLYGQTDDDVRRASDAFFGGIVQLMSQVPGLCVLLFVEEGLWNRIVPPLPSHILDRIHEPIHIPEHGTVRQVRLSTPTLAQLLEVVSCRIRRTLADFPHTDELPQGFPFGMDFLGQLAKRETVLRLMLQGCCNRLDEMFDGSVRLPEQHHAVNRSRAPASPAAPPSALETSTSPVTKTPAPSPSNPTPANTAALEADFMDRWHQEVRAAQRKLKPVGSLAGATGELQGGLARWLHLCKELGVEQDDWRMCTLQDQVQIGDHPSYGSLTVVEWTNAKGDTQQVGIGLWLGRGVGKPRDLETKLQVFKGPDIIDHLILFRPADDDRLSGRTLSAWSKAVDAGHSLRMESIDLEGFAKLYAFPRWMQQVHDAFPQGNVPEELYLFLARETEPIMLKLGLPSERVTSVPVPSLDSFVPATKVPPTANHSLQVEADAGEPTGSATVEVSENHDENQTDAPPMETSRATEEAA